MLVEFHNPVRCVFGPGSLSALGALAAGQRTLLVTFPEARALGLMDRVREQLGASLVATSDDVRSNPDVAELAPAYDGFWTRDRLADDVDLIVAVGGGSTIDTAKVLAAATEAGRFADLISGLAAGGSRAATRFKRLIAVPTTAGTGSEVTPWATVWDRTALRKHSLEARQLWPAATIIDPDLMLSLPAAVTLASGLDALSHALEAIWNVNANPISDTLAVDAVRDILDALPRLMSGLSDPSLRSRMALAALKAGLAFSNTRTALAHSISYEMTLRHGLAHGIACSFTLPWVLERAIGHRTDRDAVLAQALGPLSSAAARLRDFLEGLGVSTRFEDYGVGDEEVAVIVARAAGRARGRNFIGKP